MDRLIFGRKDALGLSDAPVSASRLFKDDLFRAPSLVSQTSSDHQQAHGFFDLLESDDSDSSFCAHSSTRRIALAKAVLQEATAHGCTTAYRGKNTCNSGALGPLLGLLQESNDLDKCCCCLDTLAFLLLDRATRKAISGLGGVTTILEVLHRFPDQANIQTKALEALWGLVKHDESERAKLWLQGGSGSLLDLIVSKQSLPQLLELLCFTQKTAFRTDSGVVHLFEPCILPCISSLLHPRADSALLLKVLQFFILAAKCVEPLHMPSWNPVIFHLVPLITGPTQKLGASFSLSCFYPSKSCGHKCQLLETTLQLLLILSDQDSFHSALFASGCITPLLSLLVHPMSSIGVMATSIIANLVDSRLSRQQLSRGLSLQALLCSLQGTKSSEVHVGVLYILGRLATWSSHVIVALNEFGAEQLLLHLSTRDEDVLLGAKQLLGIMQQPAAIQKQMYGQMQAHPSGTLVSSLSCAHSDLTVRLENRQCSHC